MKKAECTRCGAQVGCSCDAAIDPKSIDLSKMDKDQLAWLIEAIHQEEKRRMDLLKASNWKVLGEFDGMDMEELCEELAKQGKTVRIE